MKHFISLLDYSTEDLYNILNRSDELAADWRHNQMPQSLKNKQIGLWFFGNGFRNRLAFEIGLKSMGACISYIPGELGVNEPLEDVAQYLSNWYSLLIIRARKHEDLIYLTNTSSVPIVNARTDLGHPCEIMGDLQFIRRYRGSLDNLKVVFVGEVTNLCMSWFEAAIRFPIHVIQVAPKGFEAKKDLLEQLNSAASGSVAASNDLEQSLDHADVIYTDCWPRVNCEEEKKRIADLFLPYQITTKHLATLPSRAIFLPCPLVTRGQEVSDAAMTSEKCMNFKAKEYLLHCQNAIVEQILCG